MARPADGGCGAGGHCGHAHGHAGEHAHGHGGGAPARGRAPPCEAWSRRAAHEAIAGGRAGEGAAVVTAKRTQEPPAPPPHVGVVPMPPVKDAPAREGLRAKLQESGHKNFDAEAYLPPRALEDAERARKAVHLQMRLDMHLPGVDEAALDGVYEDVLAVARAHPLADEHGCKLVVTLARGNMCKFLHIDHVPMRAMCTLLGKGTEWLADQAAPEVEACVSANLAGDIETANRYKAEFERSAAIACAAERETVLMRGACWPGLEARAALHRSPTLPPGAFRLLVKADPLDASLAPWCASAFRGLPM